MGWYYTSGSTLKSIIAECASDWENTAANGQYTRMKVLAKCFRGAVTHSGVLWTVWESYIRKVDSPIPIVERFIGCHLLQYQRGYGWGYKPMDESMHPYYYSCPEKYLRMVPQVASAEWREGVKQYHINRRAKREAKKVLV